MGKILVTLGGVVIFILFAALITPYFIDWNRYKPVIEEQGAALIGRQLHIDGQISVRLLPQPVLRMSGVRILGDHGDILLGAKVIEARLAIEPLLKNNIEITHIEAVEPVLKLVRNQAGVLNWRLSGAGGNALAGIGRVSVQNLNIKDGRIIYRDEPREFEKTINLVNADITAMSLKGPFKASGRLGASRSGFKLATGRVGETGKLQISGVLSGSFGEARLKGLMRDIFNDLSFAGKLSFRRDKSNGDFLPLSLEAQLGLKSTALQLRDIAGSLGDGSSEMRYKGSLSLIWKDKPQLSGQFSARRADIDGLAGKQVNFASLPDMLVAGAVPLLPSGLEGEVGFKIAGGLLGGKRFSDFEAKVKSDGSQFSLAPFKVTLPGQSGFEVSGRFENSSDALGFNGSFALVTPDLREFSEWAGYSGVFAPGRGGLGFQIKSKISLDPQGVEFADLTGKLGGARFGGDFRRSFSGIGNKLDVDIERFDIDRYFAAKATNSAAAGLSFTPVRPSLWAKRFAVLLKGKSDLSVKIGKLSHGGAEYKNFSGDLRFNDGDLTIHRFSYETGRDKKLEISGSITDLGTRPQTHLQIKLKSADASGAVPDYILENLPELKRLGLFGRAGLDLRFTGVEEGKRVRMELRGGGIIGGSKALIEADFAGVPERADDGQIKWRLELVNSSAGDLLDQLNIPGRGGGWDAGEGVFEIKGRGAINLLMPFSASLLLPDMQVSLAGTIEKGEEKYRFSDARFNLKMQDFRLFERRLNGSFSGAQPVPLYVTAALSGSMNDLVVAGASGAAGGAPFSAYGRMVLDGERPQIELNLKPERFDLPLVIGGLLNARADEESAGGRLWSASPFDVERLHGFMLDLNMETAQLRLSDGMVLKNASFNARIGKGVFEVQTLAGQLMGGQLLGSASFEDDGSGALEGRLGVVLEGGRLAEIFKGAGAREIVEGAVSVKAELDARGRSLAGLVSSLDGPASISITGARLGVPDPFATALIAGAAHEAGDLERAMKNSIGWGASSYVLDKIRGRVSNGVLRIEEAAFVMDGRKGSFKLFSDFSTRNVDARWAFPLPGLKDSPLLTVVYSGPFSELRARADISALLRYVTGRRIEREAEDSRQKAIGGRNNIPPAGVIKKNVRTLPGLSGAAAQ